jgi:hypothetical protein
MVAEGLFVRGIEVAVLVLVVLAIARNVSFPRSGRERDPMRMSRRDLYLYLVDERVGDGKHVLRNIKLRRLSDPLIALRKNLLRQNRPDLWLETFEQTMGALRAITERIDLYDQLVHGMRKSDRRMFRKAIRTDAAALVKRTRIILRSSRQPLTQDIKNTLLGVPTRNDGAPLAQPLSRRSANISDRIEDARRTVATDGVSTEAGFTLRDTTVRNEFALLPEPMRRRIADISCVIEAALRALPADDVASEAGFTLRETLDRYLPDTLAAYFKVAAIDKAAAEAELEPQIRLIEESTRTSIAALRDGRLTELTTNGIFLRERLAAGGEARHPAAGPHNANRST